MASFVFLLSLSDKGLITLFFMPIINQIWLHYRSSAKKHAIGIQRKYEVKIISRWQPRLYNDLHTKGRLIWEQNNRTSYRWRLPCSIFGVVAANMLSPILFVSLTLLWKKKVTPPWERLGLTDTMSKWVVSIVTFRSSWLHWSLPIKTRESAREFYFEVFETSRIRYSSQT